MHNQHTIYRVLSNKSCPEQFSKLMLAMPQLINIIVQISSDSAFLDFKIEATSFEPTSTVVPFSSSKTHECWQCGSAFDIKLFLSQPSYDDQVITTDYKAPITDVTIKEEIPAVLDILVDTERGDVKDEPPDSSADEPVHDFEETGDEDTHFDGIEYKEPTTEIIKIRKSRRRKREVECKPIAANRCRNVVLEEHKELYLEMRNKALELNTWPFYEQVLSSGTHEDDLHFYQRIRTSPLYMSSFDLRSMTCDICGESTTEMTALLRHRNLHFFEGKVLLCMACNTQFPSTVILSRHTLICRGRKNIKPMACKFCGRSYKNYRVLRLHEIQHRSEQPRVKRMCHLCSKTFYDHSGLVSHLRKVHGLNPYRCDHCSKTFADLHQTRLHLWEKHFSDFCEHRCEFCGRPYATLGRMQSHIEMTHNETRFTCKVCSKDFANPASLKTHIECAHTEVQERKKWYCELCGKMFLRKNGLMSHQDKHLTPDQYQYKCSTCGKAYPSKYKLKAHEKLHTDPVPTCEFCGKTFTTKQYLKDHINLHTVSFFQKSNRFVK